MGIPPNWAAYIAVDDCDAAVARIKANGGQILVGPSDVMGSLGRMAACVDPTGAAFCVWQAKDHIGIRVMEEPGALCWTELMTKDTAKARDFYAGIASERTTHSPLAGTGAAR